MRSIAAFLTAASAAFFLLCASAHDIWLDRPAGFVWGADWTGHRTSSPTGIAATLSGDAAISGRKLALDGTGDWMTTNDAADLDVGAAFAVSVWLEPNAPGTGATRVPVSRYFAAANKRSWVLSLRYADTPQRVYGVIGNGTSAPVIYVFNQTLPTTGWHHYLMVFDNTAGDGQRIKVYYDGAPLPLSSVLYESSTVPFSTDIGVRVGNDGDGTASTAWKGNIGTVMLLNRAPSDQEAARLYNEGSSKIAAGATP